MTSSARLQQEATVARAGLSSALDELRESVTTTALTNGAMTFAKEGSTAVARAAIDRAMTSPLAAMLIGAGVVMLKSDSGPATITVSAGSQSITAPVVLSSGLTATVTQAADTLTLSGGIDGAGKALTKMGAGELRTELRAGEPGDRLTVESLGGLSLAQQRA